MKFKIVRKKLLLDNNLAILFVVGECDPRYIEKHKRISPNYDISDYEILLQIITKSGGLLFTPNLFTEMSNLLRQIGNPIKDEIPYTFSCVIQKYSEIFVDSKITAQTTQFETLGLTDTILFKLCETGAKLLTVNLDLYLAASKAGFDVENYTYI